MNFLLLIRDPERDIKGQHVDGWVIKYTYDDEHPDHHTRLINAKRGEHLDRKAIILYGKRIHSPIEDDKIAQSMGPGEWLHDEDDPSTWDEWTKQYHRRSRCIQDLCYLEVDQPKLTEQQLQAVIDIVSKWGLTQPDFRNLDEKPGDWGYDYLCQDGARRPWHHKLRQARNAHGVKLWETLRGEA